MMLDPVEPSATSRAAYDIAVKIAQVMTAAEQGAERGVSAEPRGRIERRGPERVPVNWQGTLMVEHLGQAVECAILDITADGARVSIREALRLPKAVKLCFARTGELIEAEVAWQLGFDLGLRFVHTGLAATPEQAAA